MFQFLSNLEQLLDKWKKLYSNVRGDEYAPVIKLASQPIPILASINRPYIKGLLKSNFTREELNALSKAKRKPIIHALMTAVAIRNRFILQPELMNADYRSVLASFTSKYHPELYSNLDQTEELYIARHILTVQELMKVLPPERNQGLYLAVGALLEDSNVIYTTGGDPSRATRRRQDVFRSLSGTVPCTRSPNNAGAPEASFTFTPQSISRDDQEMEDDAGIQSDVSQDVNDDQYPLSQSQQQGRQQAAISIEAEMLLRRETTNPQDDDCALMSFKTSDLLDIMETIPLTEFRIPTATMTTTMISPLTSPSSTTSSAARYPNLSNLPAPAPATYHYQPPLLPPRPHPPASVSVVSLSTASAAASEEPENDNGDVSLQPISTDDVQNAWIAHISGAPGTAASSIVNVMEEFLMSAEEEPLTSQPAVVPPVCGSVPQPTATLMQHHHQQQTVPCMCSGCIKSRSNDPNSLALCTFNTEDMFQVFDAQL